METIKQIPYGVSDFESVMRKGTPDAQDNYAVLRMGVSENGRSVNN